MQGVDNTGTEAWLSVAWRDGTPDAGDDTFERGAAFAALLARTLRAAGYEPRRLRVGIGRGRTLELHVEADVPGMPPADFESLARVALNAVQRRRDLGAAEEVELIARLAPASGGALRAPTTAPLTAPSALPALGPASVEAGSRARPAASAERLRRWAGRLPLGRLVVSLFFGLLLGVLGLPRLEFSVPSAPAAPPAPQATMEHDQPSTTSQMAELATRAPIAAETPRPATTPSGAESRQLATTAADGEARNVPTEQPTALPTPTFTPAPTDRPRATPTPAVLFAQRFVAPLADWPNDEQRTAWFEDGAYHLMARDPGRFVAVGVPLAQSFGDGSLSAQFHKIAGPSGGGYGLIVRDQGSSLDRDSLNQAGHYLVLEVGDMGEVGIWQRDDTRWIDVLAWRRAASVRRNTASNVLTAFTRGSSVRFEVNGETVAEVVVDALPTRGGVGIFVGGDLNETALEWLRVEGL